MGPKSLSLLAAASYPTPRVPGAHCPQLPGGGGRKGDQVTAKIPTGTGVESAYCFSYLNAKIQQRQYQEAYFSRAPEGGTILKQGDSGKREHIFGVLP